jgi:hypothetical protein
MDVTQERTRASQVVKGLIEVSVVRNRKRRVCRLGIDEWKKLEWILGHTGCS